jgi:hypothetical protein
MIYLDPEMSDTEAYYRAKTANQCKSLTNAQIMKCMCSKDTKMAKLLAKMNTEDVLSDLLDDDLYRYNVSLIRMFVENSFDSDFTSNIALLQGRNAIERAEELINDNEEESDSTLFDRKVMDATTKARSLVNQMIEEHDPPVRKTDHTQQSAAGLIYFSLALACANENESTLNTTEYITKDSVKHLFDMYLGLDSSSQKGDKHKRFYTYFTTGTFPEALPKGKKRKVGETEETEETQETQVA